MCMCRPSHRLGCRNIDQLLNHPWFGSINWRDIENKTALPYFLPGGRLAIDTSEQMSNLATYLRKEEELEMSQMDLILPEQEMLFEKFDFVSSEYEPWYSNIAHSRASLSHSNGGHGNRYFASLRFTSPYLTLVSDFSNISSCFSRRPINFRNVVQSVFSCNYYSYTFHY